MSEKINGQSGFIPGLAQTVDPDESPDRADKGYTGVDEVYQNAATRTYAPQGNLKLVPEAKAFGAVEVSKEQKEADEAAAEAARLQAEADAKAKAEADAAAEEAAKKAAASTPSTPSAPTK